MFIAAIALICSTALPYGTCIASNAEQAYYANVPQPYCVQAMQQLVAARTQAIPINPAKEYLMIICKSGQPVKGGLTADDVGQVAPPQAHTFTADEVRELSKNK